MKLERIKLHNFRCFEKLEVDLHPQVTVLVAENGQGKSTLLDALRIAVWPFIKSFDLASAGFNDSGNSIAIEDVRIIPMQGRAMARQLPAEIEVNGDYGRGPQAWCRYRESEKPRSKVKEGDGVKALEKEAKQLQKHTRSANSSITHLPVFGYYGTGRLWAQQSLSKAGKGQKDDTQDADFYIRTFGYRNCTNPSSSYKHFKEWFIWASESLSELERKTNTPEHELQSARNAVAVVQRSIDLFLKDTTGWHTLEYSVTHQKSLILHHDDYGMMKVDQLSDGIRSVLAMVGDIAYRCIKLNPQYEAEAHEKSTGLVLIDEVDMHLHPHWQQLVIQQLTSAFPNIQFVVTTHSPQVLSTVSKDSIRIISEGKLLQPAINTRGEESKVILEDLMHVPSRPKDAMSETMKTYLERINRGEINSKVVQDQRKKLEAHYGANHSQLRLADMAIHRWQAVNAAKDRKNKGKE